MNKKEIKGKIVAYFIVPLFFTIIGYGIICLAALPIINTFVSIGKIIISTEIPDFDSELKSIYNHPVENNSQQVLLRDITIPSYETLYANVSCERIGLDAPLYFGDSTKVLKNGVGQYSGSFIPGFGGPLLLAGHNTTYFLPLQNIQEGDIVVIQTEYGKYEYKITGMRVADKNDTTAYDLEQDNEQLIMYTCYPFNMLGNLQNRYFVYGDKISGPVIVE